MIESAIQIPDHVAIRILVYAPPRCINADNSGSSGDGFRARHEKGGNRNWSFPHNCEEVEAHSRFVWAYSVNVSLWNSAIVDLGRAKSLSTRGSGHMAKVGGRAIIETLNQKSQNHWQNQGETPNSGHMIEKMFQTFSRAIDGRSGGKHQSLWT